MVSDSRNRSTWILIAHVGNEGEANQTFSVFRVKLYALQVLLCFPSNYVSFKLRSF